MCLIFLICKGDKDWETTSTLVCGLTVEENPVWSLMGWARSTIKELWDKTQGFYQFTGVIVQFHIYIISYYNSYCSIKSSFSFKESLVIHLKREVWLDYQNGTLTSAVDTVFQIEEGVFVFYCRYDTTIESTMINLKVVHGGVFGGRQCFTLLCNQGWPRIYIISQAAFKLIANLLPHPFKYRDGRHKLLYLTVFNFFRAVNQMRE